MNINTKLFKKILSIVSVVCVVVAVGILISAIFGVPVFDWGPTTKILLSAAILAAVSAFAVTAIGYMNRQLVLAAITLVLLLVLGILSYIIVWASIAFSSTFTQITVTVALVTVPFCLIVDHRTKLGKKLAVLQILTYVFMTIAVAIIIALIWGVPIFSWPLGPHFSVSEWILAFMFWIILAIMGRKQAETYEEKPRDPTQQAMPQGGMNSVTISKFEYEGMKAQIQQLQAENYQLRSQLGGMGFAPQTTQYQQPQPQPAQPQQVPKNLPKKLPRKLNNPEQQVAPVENNNEENGEI